MNELTRVSDGISAQTLEHVIGTGDISRMTAQQKVEYSLAVCRSIGLNPLTRPFRFMKLSGQEVMYATRDCGDQLRSVKGISVEIVDKRIEDDLFIVTARARDAKGRQDEDMGAVTIGQLRGEARANAIMKAITKAKRRVTLSICGLGMLDETEVESIPGAVIEPDPPPPPSGQPTRTADVLHDSIPADEERAPPKPRTRREFLDDLERHLAAAADSAAVDAILAEPDVQRAQAEFRNGHLDRLNAMVKAALERTAKPADAGRMPEEPPWEATT